MRDSFVGVIFIFGAIGGIIFNIINIWIVDYRTIFYIQSTTLILGGFGYWMLLESPMYLYKKHDFDNFIRTINYLCKFNYQDDPNYPIVQAKLDQQYSRMHDVQVDMPKEALSAFNFSRSEINAPVAAMARSKAYLRIVAVTIIVGNLYIAEGIMALIPQEMGIDNIYLNTVMLCIAEILSYLSLVFVTHRTKRRLLNTAVCFVILFISLTAMVSAATDMRNTNHGKLIESSLSILLRIVTCMNFVLVFNYVAELFDIKYRGLALGICIFVGRASMGSASLLVDFAHVMKIHPIATNAFSAIIALPLCLFLPETRYVKGSKKPF